MPLALGIARALAHLHSKRIVHGDLNPNNVLLKQDPAQPSGYGVKVGDFGLRCVRAAAAGTLVTYCWCTRRAPTTLNTYAGVSLMGRSVLLPHDRTHLSNIVMGTMFYICPEVACKVR